MAPRVFAPVVVVLNALLCFGIHSLTGGFVKYALATVLRACGALITAWGHTKPGEASA